MAGTENMSSNFVSEVLANAGRLEKEDLNAKLGKLSKRIKQVKEEVYESLRAIYVDSDPCFEMAKDLHERTEAISTEINALETKISKDIKGQLQLSTTEFQELSGQLSESMCMLSVLERLVQIKTCLDKSNDAFSLKQYTVAAQNLTQVKQLLEQPLGSRDSEILVMKSLREAHTQAMIRLISDTEESWSECFKWQLPKKDSETQVVEITLPNSKRSQQLLQETAQTMAHLNTLNARMKVLGRRFMDYIVSPVLDRSSTDVSLPCTSNTTRLTINIGKKNDKPGALADIRAKLNLALTSLHENALCQEITKDEKQVTLMQLLGQQIGEEFTELYISKCLSRFIPTSRSELLNFGKIKKIQEYFQKHLVEIKFLPETNTQLTDYVNNVDSLFANKKSQEILEKARELMRSDLHNTVKVSQEEVADVPLPAQTAITKQAKTAVNYGLINKKLLHSNTFKFPTCMISAAVKDLMVLVYETLHEATMSSPDCTIQLFYVTRRVFDLYISVVPTYHKDSLATLPQLAALHHNNCMYIAHHLVTLGHQFTGQLQPKDLDTTVGDSLQITQGELTYVDLIPSIRRLGVECFLQMMTLQKNQIIEFLSSAQGFQGVSEDSQFKSMERAIKQSLHQLQRLSNIWRNVLPTAVHNKAMGTLLKALMSEIVGGITSLEDISADDATMLHMLTESVVEKAPELLLPTPGSDAVSVADLHAHVSNWMRFQELQRLLNANLQEIGDRWAEGKGPLAAEFSSNEVKQLVRALFQNTDRRSAVLAKIR